MLTELSELLDLLRAKGVQHYAGPSASTYEKPAYITITFAPPAPAPDDKPDAKVPDPDMCACGHAMTEHQGGACLHACEEEKCA